MKCANCEKDAMFEYRITQNKSLFYCGTDLPSFLDERRKAGLLTITEKFKEELTNAASLLAPVPAKVEEDKPKKAKKVAKKNETNS